MGGLVYDTGALVAAGRGERAIWDLHRGALQRSEAPLVIAPVLTLAWAATERTGTRTETLAGFLRGCALTGFPIAAAYDAGLLLARSGTTDLATAAVVLAAITTRSALVTTNPDAVRALARALAVQLPVAVV